MWGLWHRAAGVDLDRESLAWGAKHNGDGLLGGSAPDQLCLLHSNVGHCSRILSQQLRGARHMHSSAMPVLHQNYSMPSRKDVQRL